MSAPAISAAASPSPVQAAQYAGQHRNRVHAPSMSDLDTQGSSVAGPAKPTSRVGSQVDLKV